jgi:hypothetical protein
MQRSRFGFAAGSGVAFTESITFSLIEFLLAACCGRDIHHSASEKQQVESAGDHVDEANDDRK